MAKILVLGGGFGGIAAAISLRERLGADHQVTLVDRRKSFFFGFRKTWAFLGSSPLQEGMHPLAALEAHGIDVLNGSVDSIEPEKVSASIDGTRLEADAMVVSLGAQARPDLIPGFLEHGLDFYGPTKIDAAAERLSAFQGGRVAIVILGLPYSCPPVPFEAALLLREYFSKKRLDVDLHVYSPQPMSLPVVGEAGCSIIEGRMEQNGISFHPNHVIVGVEPDKLKFATAADPYDLLIGIPAHTCPEVVVESGLAEAGGWARVDARTLESKFPEVYAIGDAVTIPMANGKALPKAGVFAEAHGQVAAARIAAKIRGNPPAETFDGSGYCYLEVGDQHAMLVQGNFLAEPKPKVSLAEPSPEHYQAKLEFERSRLETWFGK